VGFVTLLALALALAVLSPSAALGDARPIAQVKSRLVFDADRSGEIDARMETTMSAPVSFGPIADLFGSGNGSSEARQRAARFFKSRFGLFPPDELDAAPRDVEITDGVVTASIEERLPSAPDFDYLRSAFGISWSEGVHLYTVEPRTPKGVSWEVTFDVDRVEVEKMFPAPSALTYEGSRTVASWYFPPGEGAPVHLTLDPVWEIRFVAGVTDGDWDDLNAILSLALSLLFIPVLFLLLKRSDLRFGGCGPILWHQVRWLMLATVFALLIGCCVRGGA
jgi:hypothetical protein